MFGYLVAGLVVGGLMRALRHEPGDPPLFVQLCVGLIAGGLAGLVVNVLLGEDFLALDPWGFTAASIAALVALLFVQSRARRNVDEPIDG